MDTSPIADIIAERLSRGEGRQHIIADLIHLGYERKAVERALNELYASGVVPDASSRAFPLGIDASIIQPVSSQGMPARFVGWMHAHTKGIFITSAILFIVVAGGGIGYEMYYVSAPKIVQDAVDHFSSAQSFAYALSASFPDAPVPISISSQGIFDDVNVLHPALSSTVRVSNAKDSSDLFAASNMFAGPEDVVYMRIDQPHLHPLFDGQLLSVPKNDFENNFFNQFGIEAYTTRMAFFYRFSPALIASLRQIIVPAIVRTITPLGTVDAGGVQAYHLRLSLDPQAAQRMLHLLVGDGDQSTVDAFANGSWDAYIDTQTRYLMKVVITPVSGTADNGQQITVVFGNYNTSSVGTMNAPFLDIATIVQYMHNVSTISGTASSTASTTAPLHP